MLSNTATPKEYALFRDSVLRGEVPINQEVSLQMNLIDHLIASPEYYYDDKAIDGFIKFCESEMTLTDGSDLTLLPSFKLWAEDLLAWFYYTEEKVFDPVQKRYKHMMVKRRLRKKQYLIVGRGAAKSVYASLIQAYGLLIDTNTTHQIVTAPTMRQADETMSPIKTAIARSRGPLFKYLTEGNVLSTNIANKQRLASTKKGIENFITNSFIEVRTMSIDKLQGARSKYNTVDEWLSGKVKEDVIGALEQGASKNEDYIIVATSSEGTARDGVGDTIKMELLSYLHGEVYNPHVSIWYYRLDHVSEVANPEMWLKANPNIGATVSYEAYQLDADTAATVPAKRNDILAKRFGIPVEGQTYYFQYEETLPTRHKQNYDGLECVMGADLSQGDDFCAFTFIFPLSHGYGIKTRSYVSRHKYNKLPTAMQMKYDVFVKEGTLVIMDKNYLDLNEVYEDLDMHIQARDYQVIGLGYDPYNAEVFLRCWERDYGSYHTVKVRQGARTESVPLGEIKAMVEDKYMVHDEELMKFAMGNAIVIEDNNGNMKLSKRRASEKIDNVSALMDAWVAFKELKEVFG